MAPNIYAYGFFIALSFLPDWLAIWKPGRKDSLREVIDLFYTVLSAVLGHEPLRPDRFGTCRDLSRYSSYEGAVFMAFLPWVRRYEMAPIASEMGGPSLRPLPWAFFGRTGVFGGCC
jgi:hypothetical protein